LGVVDACHDYYFRGMPAGSCLRNAGVASPWNVQRSFFFVQRVLCLRESSIAIIVVYFWS
jgi:hypothetical protein